MPFSENERNRTSLVRMGQAPLWQARPATRSRMPDLSDLPSKVKEIALYGGLAAVFVTTMTTAVMLRMPSGENQQPMEPTPTARSVDKPPSPIRIPRLAPTEVFINQALNPRTPLRDAMEEAFYRDGDRVAAIYDCTQDGVIPGAPYEVVNPVNLREGPTQLSKKIDEAPKGKPLLSRLILQLNRLYKTPHSIDRWHMQMSGTKVTFAAESQAGKPYLKPQDTTPCQQVDIAYIEALIALGR